MKKLFRMNKKRKLKDGDTDGTVEAVPFWNASVRHVDDSARQKRQGLEYLRQNNTDSASGVFTKEQETLDQYCSTNGDDTSPSWRGTPHRNSRPKTHFDRTSSRRSSDASIGALAFQRQTSSRSSSGSNFGAIQNRALAMHEENHNLRLHREHSIRRIKNLENQLEMEENRKAKLTYEFEKAQTTNDGLSKIVNNLFEENQSLRLITNSGIDSEALKHREELLRKESLKNAKLERNLMDICQRLDKINPSDGKPLKRQSQLFSELKSIGQKLMDGQDDIKVQISQQSSRSENVFQLIQEFVNEIRKRHPVGLMTQAESAGNDDAGVVGEHLQSKCSNSVKQLCAHLMQMIGAKWMKFAVALGIPPDVVGEINTGRATRLSFEAMFFKIIACATKYGELSVSGLLKACLDIGINPYRETPMSSVHKEVLRRKADRLTNGLHPASVLSKLRESLVVTTSEIEYVLETELPTDQVQRLMDVLPFLGENGFNALLDALKSTGDKYLAEELQYEETLLTQGEGNDQESDIFMMDAAAASEPETPRTLPRTFAHHGMNGQDVAALMQTQADMKTKICEIQALLLEKDHKGEQFV